jgi:hypothetical protein
MHRKFLKKYSLEALQDNIATRHKEVMGDINK